MKSEQLNLNKIIDLNKWQSLQDSLSIVTKLAIITVDYKGVPVSNHSFCSEFCNSVRNNPKLASYCQKCDSRGGLEAVRINKPYIYLCHYNIVDIAIPIIIDDKYIGAIMAGQVKLKNKKDEESLEKILTLPGNLELHDLNDLYLNLPSLSYEEVENIADMLFKLCNYIVEESLNKSFIIEMYEKEILNKNLPNNDLNLSSYNENNIKNLKDELSYAITNSHIKDLSFNKDFLSNSILKPAIDYIHKNKNENVSLEKASNLCHISPSYFSRVFKKEVGQNFSTYVSSLKIEWSKELLESTNMSISEISDNLGFNEAGYFIKTFKKQEGLTPFLYRKYTKK
ncbi:PocR ligand-binding domain-containing protein [Clostridium sp. D53t1_180928_C8]|uniref:PocR ligand-binding domain-containing protein n=1 Tax=Clostridium sp. D53t1_180928_C8 TaxID=2787101 RepID=UPI0018AB4F59|nr:PocR ligand-binding domain-containing protein [Clostridium sp. D53t1_180928_C8]